MDAGVFFIKPTFSKKSSAPTCLGELLGCGVPCLVIGDMDEVILHEQVGVVMREFSPNARAEAVCEMLRLCGDSAIRRRCTEAAQRHFALEHGVASYK